MGLKLTPEAVEDLENLSEKEVGQIKSKLKVVSSELSHKALKLISNPVLSHGIWQLTVNKEDLEHRAYLDVYEGDIVVLGVFDFEFTHSGDGHWEELRERM